MTMHILLSSHFMLSVYICAIAVVSLTASSNNEKDECGPVENGMAIREVILEMVNERRSKLVRGDQQNGPNRANKLPQGENIRKMVGCLCCLVVFLSQCQVRSYFFLRISREDELL
ncbi:hypothetical protein ANCCAN_08061 [Ancylostoma caninum]|uniref:Secreted protein n=1 Tax=Ancylostoma caninum TaxID=29170 RepID=A0A368GNE9_ANCCA|nr:hypothetical protein ANCCAN_08061 [Ancylostoma caninum]